MNMTIATIKGAMNSSIEIIVNKLHDVGDIISFDNLSTIAPHSADYTKFFYDCISFCKSNGDSRFFRIDQILEGIDNFEFHVSPVTQPVKALPRGMKRRYTPYSDEWY